MTNKFLLLLSIIASTCLANVLASNNTTIALPTNSSVFEAQSTDIPISTHQTVSPSLAMTSLAMTSLAITSSPAPSTNHTDQKGKKDSDKDDFQATVTFYLLIACTGLFAIILLFIVILVVQLCRVQKTLRRKIPANAH